MDTTVEADSVSFILQREDAGQMTVAATKEDLIEETENRAKNAHHMDSLLSLKSVLFRRKNKGPKAETKTALLTTNYLLRTAY